MQKLFFILSTLFLFINNIIHAQSEHNRAIINAEESIVGASRTELYLPILQNKRVGIIANQTSIFSNTHLVDTLLKLEIDIKAIFTPEHGFRGSADEGTFIANSIDEKTNLPIISLYGSNKKPNREQLKDIDILLFDLQDVGTRFYTYISTMTYIMEAAAEIDIPVIVLDRPNPNGFYIDGPIMEDENTSFVGLHHIPIVYGMTIGEYALMVNGEYWLNDSLQCDLTIIPLGNYKREAIYKLPVKPSPNLPNWQSVYLYPSLCLFEGTIVSIGRGTETPFQVYGHPLMEGEYSFIPKQKKGKRAPLHCDKTCHGENIYNFAENYKNNKAEIELNWLINAYNQLHEKDNFFNNFFVKLSGTKDLQNQIIEGVTEDDIRHSWQAGIDDFKTTRDKYLIYDDF